MCMGAGHGIFQPPRDGYPSRHDGFQEHPARYTYNGRIAHTRGREVRMETVNVAVRMERQTRDDAAKLFSELGVSTTQVINMFLKQAVREQRMPFEVTARPAVERGSESMEKQRTCPSRRPPQRPCG